MELPSSNQRMPGNSRRLEQLLLEHFPYEPTQGQRKLLGQLAGFMVQSSEYPVFVMKGYAGTGKTTIVAALVRVLPLLEKKTVLLAPTGRAAKVLSSYSGKRAYTIHKKIYRPKTNSDGNIYLSLMPNLHRDTLFIVDEASMIPDEQVSDDRLFASRRSLLEDLFDYVFANKNNKLLLLGDTAQLPPVGSASSPALDPAYLRSRFKAEVESCELTEVMRQAEESGILVNATLLREKILQAEIRPPFFSLREFKDILQLPPGELEDLLNTCLSRDPENTVVITRSNKRANLFNNGIRNRILFREDEIAAGDHLMVVKNNYYWLPPESDTGFIANGDIVEVLRIRKTFDMYGFHYAEASIRLLDYPEEKDLEVMLLLDTLQAETPSLSRPDQNRLFNEILLDFAEIPSKRSRIEKTRNHVCYNALQVKFAYALTCHKTQGGQWEHVIVDQGYLTQEMIDLEYLRWLYTAVTRSYGKLYLLNFKEEFFN